MELVFHRPVMILPFPSLTLSSLLGHFAPVDLSAGNTPGAVPLAGDDIIEDGQKDLDEQANAHGDEDLGRVVETAETIDQAGLGLSVWRGIDETVTMLSILALEFGNDDKRWIIRIARAKNEFE